MDKGTTITILKCILLSCIAVLQALINLPQLEGSKVYLSIATGGLILFETVLERQIRINYKQKKYANPPPVAVSYEARIPETVQAIESVQDRSLGFVHRLVQPTGVPDKGRSLPERYNEYSDYTLPDFNGQRGIGMSSTTPVGMFV
jgi:hypothetical protein